MSKTLMTKSEAIRYTARLGHMACDRVAQLEAELAEAQSKIAHFEKVAERMAIREQELKSELAAKNALLKQCLEALEAISTATMYKEDSPKGTLTQCKNIAWEAIEAARKEVKK